MKYHVLASDKTSEVVVRHIDGKLEVMFGFSEPYKPKNAEGEPDETAPLYCDCELVVCADSYEAVESAVLACGYDARTAVKVARKAFDMPYTLEYVKADKLAELKEYDNSSAVNGFSYQGNVMWLKFDKRKDVRAGVDAMIASGRGNENYELWNSGVCISIPAAVLGQMLNTVEVYALKCYAVTARHEAAINALEGMDEVKAYNFTVGYPEKLTF